MFKSGYNFSGERTLFTGSSCFDVVASESGSVVSGHFDRKVRFCDHRSGSTVNEIALQAKVTSLDLSSGSRFQCGNSNNIQTEKYMNINQHFHVVKAHNIYL